MTDLLNARKEDLWLFSASSPAYGDPFSKESHDALPRFRFGAKPSRIWGSAKGEKRMGTSDAELDDYVSRNVRADLYLLTGDEIPFIQDGLRDGEHIRHDMHTWFEEALSNQSTPWRIVRGSREQRLHSALSAIRELEVPLR